MKKLEEVTEMFTKNDIDSEQGYYDGKIVVLYPSWLNDQHRTPQNQLFVAKGGFGCSPITMGTAVIGEFLIDGEQCRISRGDVMGVLKKSVANELGFCPCGKKLDEELVMNALSRKDNETYICKKCEEKELQEELDKLNS